MGRVNVTENLGARGVAKPLVAGDIELGAEFFALISIKNAQRYGDADAYINGNRRVACEIRAEGGIGRAVGNRKPVIRLSFINGLNRRFQIGPDFQCDLAELIKGRDLLGKVKRSGYV